MQITLEDRLVVGDPAAEAAGSAPRPSRTVEGREDLVDGVARGDLGEVRSMSAAEMRAFQP